jgi:polysaccharide pyruvyl transferase
MQTVALCRILGMKCYGMYRDERMPTIHNEYPFIVNGWLGEGAEESEETQAVFAGVHLAKNESRYLRWMKSNNKVVGARDPYTVGLLNSLGQRSKLVGCATLTLPKYTGPRMGTYTIDVAPQPGSVSLTQKIGDLSWHDQWILANARLDKLKTANLVYTSRLHVVLPCLAFGTPVVFPSHALDRVPEKQRLTILDALDFRYDFPFTADVSSIAADYVDFLTRELGITCRPSDFPEEPVPISRLSPTVQPVARRQDKGPRVYYVMHDEHRKWLDLGEVEEHVRTLRKNGIDAAMITPDRDADALLDEFVPTISMDEMLSTVDQQRDVAVVAPKIGSASREIPCRKVALFNNKASSYESSRYFGVLRDGDFSGFLVHQRRHYEMLQLVFPDHPSVLLPRWLKGLELCSLKPLRERKRQIAVMADAPGELQYLIDCLKTWASQHPSLPGTLSFVDLRCVASDIESILEESVAACFLVDGVYPEMMSALGCGCVVLAYRTEASMELLPDAELFERGDIVTIMRHLTSILCEPFTGAAEKLSPRLADRCLEETLRWRISWEESLVTGWLRILAHTKTNKPKASPRS